MPNDLLTKNEAAILLDSTSRGIENWVAKKKLTPVFVDGKHGKEWRFNRSDIEEFKKQRSEVQYMPIRQPSQSLAVQPELIERLVAVLENQLPVKMDSFDKMINSVETRLAVPLAEKLFLNPKECAALSGLTLTHIKNAIKERKLNAIKEGRVWLVTQAELRRYASTLHST